MPLRDEDRAQISMIVASHRLAGRLDLEQSEQLHQRLIAGVASFRSQWAEVVEALGGGDPAPTADRLVMTHLDIRRAFHLVHHPAEAAERADTLARASRMPERLRWVTVASMLVHDEAQEVDLFGSPLPSNEPRSHVALVESLRVAGVPIDARLVNDSFAIVMATKFNADRTTEIVVTDAAPPVDVCARGDLSPRERLDLVHACNIASDADIGGVAFRTSTLDNRLLEIEDRRLGPAKVRAKQEYFVETLASRPGGPFHTAEANELWGSWALDNLALYRATLDARAAAPMLGR